MKENLTISGAAKWAGLPTDTLRYYERLGLLTPSRTPGGRRVYEGKDLLLLRFVARMRATEMPLEEIRRYLDLAAAGAGTAGRRREMLVSHAMRIQGRIKTAQDALSTIQIKLQHFDEIQRGEIPDGATCSTERPVRRAPAPKRTAETMA